MPCLTRAPDRWASGWSRHSAALKRTSLDGPTTFSYMRSKLLRQAPVVRTVIGADSHRGWLPAGASEPLVTQPLESIVDLRVLQQGNGIKLEWLAHEMAHWPLPSARGSRICESLTDAEARADHLFGVQAADWSLVRDDGILTSADVERVTAQVLAEYDVTDPAAEGWGTLVIPPRVVDFRLADGAHADLWLILDSLETDSYVVHYDAETGDYGIGSRTDGNGYMHIGAYGPLWTTLVSM